MFKLMHRVVNMNTVEINFKCLTRWYFTLSVAQKQREEISPLCWRGCGGRGTMAHIWWECLQIQGYWQDIIQYIQEILGITIQKDMWVCLFY
ncbi:unnamed protein product, partial [Staurois parvus]